MNSVDALLALVLLALAVACLWVKTARSGSLLFIAFGLLLALAWVRLGAIDVALAEAAIGAGIAGALLLDAARQFEHSPAGQDSMRVPSPWPSSLWMFVLAAVLLYALSTIPPLAGNATLAVSAALESSEIAHPVTAVLLAFRAYDTLLEIAVLLVAVLAAQAAPSAIRASPKYDPALAAVVGWMVPIAILVAVYLLWAGSSRTGGAFQAAAVLAGAILLARFSGQWPDADRLWKHAGAGVFGLVTFILVGLSGAFTAGAVLGYPAGWAGILVLGIEAALMLSIAASLLALFGWKER